MRPLTVVVTAVGCPGGPSIVQALREGARAAGRPLRLVGTDCRPDAPARYLCDAFATVPPGSDPAFVPSLDALCRQERADVVLPLASPELLPLAMARDTFPCAIAVSPARAVAVLENKADLYRWAAVTGLGHLVPRHRLTRTWAELARALADLGYPEKPVVVKPPVAHGSRGVRIVWPDGDLRDRLLHHKPDPTAISFPELRRLLAGSDPFPPLLAVEYLPGDEWSVDLLVSPAGQVLAAVPRRRLATWGGICVASQVEPNRPLAEAASALARAAGLAFAGNVQFRATAAGQPRLLEVNPRLPGTVAATVAAGLNLPWLAVALATGWDPGPLPEPAWGTRVERHWKEVVFRGTAEDSGGGL